MQIANTAEKLVQSTALNVPLSLEEASGLPDCLSKGWLRLRLALIFRPGFSAPGMAKDSRTVRL